MKIVEYKSIHRGQWAELKLDEVKPLLPNKIVSDIGAGFGWFKQAVLSRGLTWQAYDYIRKIEEATIWDLNNPAPQGSEMPGFVVFLEVLEHLDNPELGLRNIYNHMDKGAYMALSTPNPQSALSKYKLFKRGNLYAFQPKHLSEHHVYIPMPHIVRFHLENLGFEVLEYALIGKIEKPKFKFNLDFLKSVFQFLLIQMLIFFKIGSGAPIQAFFVKKK